MPTVVETQKVLRCICSNCGRIWTPRYGKLPKVCRYCKVKTWNQAEKKESSSA